MTNIDTGIQGAKRQSFHESSPRGLLKRVIENNPDATETELLELYECEIQKQIGPSVTKLPDTLSAIIEYWFARNYRSLTENLPTPQTMAEAKAKYGSEVAASANRVKEAAVRMVLLDFKMPNGKLLKDSTGRDCAKAGGWFAKIAKRIGAKQIVGKVLSEADVRKMYRG